MTVPSNAGPQDRNLSLFGQTSDKNKERDQWTTSYRVHYAGILTTPSPLSKIKLLLNVFFFCIFHFCRKKKTVNIRWENFSPVLCDLLEVLHHESPSYPLIALLSAVSHFSSLCWNWRLKTKSGSDENFLPLKVSLFLPAVAKMLAQCLI